MVTSVTSGLSIAPYDYAGTSEATLKDMGKIVWIE